MTERTDPTPGPANPVPANPVPTNPDQATSPGPAVDAAGRSRLPLWAALALAVLCGALVAIQSSINGALGVRLDDGFTAAVISFGSGLILLTVALLVAPTGRAGLRAVIHSVSRGGLPWWYLLGGCSGALLVLAQGLVAATLGVALFMIAIVAGQTISGLVLDRIGIGPSGVHRLTAPRVIGAAIALVAVSWAVSVQLAHDVPLWMLLLPFIAGLGTGWQQAVNGRVRQSSGSALASTFINFVAGTIVLVIAAAVHIAVAGWPNPFPTEPWLYVGGSLGCVFIAGTAILVHRTGVLLLSLATIAGQLIAALAIDAIVGDGSKLAVSTVGGTVLALAAVAIASLRPGAFSRAS